MIVLAQYVNPDHTSVVILSGFPGAPVLGENGNPHNPAGQAAWDAAHADGNVPSAYVSPPSPTVYVSKLAIVRRLSAAGKLNDVVAIRDADPLLREEWAAAVSIASDDHNMIRLLDAVGADPAVILDAET